MVARDAEGLRRRLGGSEGLRRSSKLRSLATETSSFRNSTAWTIQNHFHFWRAAFPFIFYVDDTQCPAIRFHPPVRFVLNEMGSRTLLIPIQDCVHNRLRIGIHLSHSSAANWGAQGLRRNREEPERRDFKPNRRDFLPKRRDSSQSDKICLETSRNSLEKRECVKAAKSQPKRRDLSQSDEISSQSDEISSQSDEISCQSDEIPAKATRFA